MNLTIITDNLRIKPLKDTSITELHGIRQQVLSWAIAMGFRLVYDPSYPALFVWSSKIEDVQIPYLIMDTSNQPTIYIQLVKCIINYGE